MNSSPERLSDDSQPTPIYKTLGHERNLIADDLPYITSVVVIKPRSFGINGRREKQHCKLFIQDPDVIGAFPILIIAVSSEKTMK